MKLKEALEGDYRKEEVRQYIQDTLKQIPVLAHYEDDVPLEVLEKVLWKLGRKYGACMQYLMPSFDNASPNHYSCSFRLRRGEDYVKVIHGLTIYEIYAKGVLMCYSYTRKTD